MRSRVQARCLISAVQFIRLFVYLKNEIDQSRDFICSFARTLSLICRELEPALNLASIVGVGEQKLRLASPGLCPRKFCGKNSRVVI